MSKYLSCADTAKLIRKALKEAFPDVKFSVRSSTYSGGASIRVNWQDGPNSAQVEAVATHFEGSYFDGSIDYKGSISHMMDGELVSMGADFVFCERSYSPQAIERAIEAVYRKYAGNFRDSQEPRVTVADFKAGRLWRVAIPGMEGGGLHFSMQGVINEAMGKHSDRLKVEKPATAHGVFITHDDNYSKTNGVGFSVMPNNL